MAQHVCSLKFDADRDGGPLPVPSGEDYHLVPFPYRSLDVVLAEFKLEYEA
jgi:hypothetical protein